MMDRAFGYALAGIYLAAGAVDVLVAVYDFIEWVFS